MSYLKKAVALLLVLFVATMAFAGGGQEEQATTGEAMESEGFDWRQFEGSTVVFNFPNHVHYNAMMDAGVIEEFEDLTGINVEVDMMQYLNMHDKQVLEMSKPNGDYDLISMVVMWKAEYAMADMIQPLEPFFDDPQLTVPDYDFDDLVPAYVEVTGIAGGENIYMDGPGAQLYGLPFGSETSFMIYRQDLFDQ